jgi:hypothetical protein
MGDVLCLQCHHVGSWNQLTKHLLKAVMPKLSAKLMVSRGPRSHGRGLLVRNIPFLVFSNNYKQTAGLQDAAAVFRLFVASHNPVYILICMHA